jgi:hypothetical protein
MKTIFLFGLVSCQDYLFLGASQVYGWQGSYDRPAYPFGKEVEQLMKVRSTILGVPGDCIGGSGCSANYPPNHVGPRITGFRPRLEYFLNTTVNSFEYTIVLGGANDINQQCFFNNPRLVQSLDQELRALTDLALTRSQKVLLLPTFNAPLYKGPKCPGLYSSFLNQFQNTTADLRLKYPGRVYFLDSTSLLLYFRDSYYYDDLHLTKEGNRAFAQGIIREILRINNVNANCNVERIDCGYMGVNQFQCEGAGCCWSPRPNSPWCFMKK